MNTSMNWLRAYVPGLSVSGQEFRDAMTLAGNKVETMEDLGENLEKIVTGKILSLEKHPDADKLSICQVDIGNEQIQIVTGAQNMKQGDVVPVVLDGGKVKVAHDGSKPKEGVEIRAGKLRGVPSNGMMCSIEELGGEKNLFPEAPESGLYIFPEGTPVGVDAVELLGLRDILHEYEITSNRVDCFSVLGLAREAAATFKQSLQYPKIEKIGNQEDVSSYLSVELKSPELCKRYTARLIKNVHFAPSPLWMQIRLRTAGIRPINNFVDITNYVMLELGQPMHAFDYDTIKGHKIIVERAKEGESFTTLDGVEHELSDSILCIKDGERSIALGGIMGGENSMITDQVKNVVLEAACFDGTNIRLSGRKLGLRTDASAYFEKGLDPNLCEMAMDRACTLIEELGAGEVVGGMLDCYPEKREDTKLTVSVFDINNLLGLSLPGEEMKKILTALEISVEVKNCANGEELSLVIPSFRQDLERMADIAEEVARFYGYDKIPSTLPKATTVGGKAKDLQLNQKLRHLAEALGYSESYFYSFESKKGYEKLLFPKDAMEWQQITIANPLGEDFSVMRTSSVPGMLQALSLNEHHKNKNAKLFEMAKIYIPKALPLTELPEERMTLTLGFAGEGDFFSLKGEVEELLRQSGLQGNFHYDRDCEKAFYHPGRKANISYEGKLLGSLGEIHPEVLQNFDMKEKAYVAILDLEALYPLSGDFRKYKPVAKFPAVTRDFSLLVPVNVMAGDLEEAIRKGAGELLEKIELFDIYVGAQVQEGYKSMSYKVSIRAKDHTLTEQEIVGCTNSLLKALEEKGARLRDA